MELLNKKLTLFAAKLFKVFRNGTFLQTHKICVKFELVGGRRNVHAKLENLKRPACFLHFERLRELYMNVVKLSVI